VYLTPVNLPQVIIRPHNNNNIGSKMMIGDVHPSSIETEDGKEKICRREVTKDVISTTDVTIKITDLYLLAMQGVEAITEVRSALILNKIKGSLFFTLWPLQLEPEFDLDS
jgi:hypothetical protein